MQLQGGELLSGKTGAHGLKLLLLTVPPWAISPRKVGHHLKVASATPISEHPWVVRYTYICIFPGSTHDREEGDRRARPRPTLTARTTNRSGNPRRRGRTPQGRRAGKKAGSPASDSRRRQHQRHLGARGSGERGGVAARGRSRRGTGQEGAGIGAL